MNLYTTLTNKLKELAEQDAKVMSVRKGLDIVADLDKNTPFPSVHLRVTRATPTATTMLFDVEIFAMALRGYDNIQQTDRFKGAYNEDKNLDETLDIGNLLYVKILKEEDLFRINGEPSFEPFYEEYMNGLDGWVGTFQIELENDATIC